MNDQPGTTTGQSHKHKQDSCCGISVCMVAITQTPSSTSAASTQNGVKIWQCGSSFCCSAAAAVAAMSGTRDRSRSPAPPTPAQDCLKLQCRGSSMIVLDRRHLARSLLTRRLSGKPRCRMAISHLAKILQKTHTRSCRAQVFKSVVKILQHLGGSGMLEL